MTAVTSQCDFGGALRMKENAGRKAGRQDDNDREKVESRAEGLAAANESPHSRLFSQSTRAVMMDRRTWVHRHLATSKRLPLGAGDTLVLQDPDYNPAVLGLAFCGRVGCHLFAGAHCAGSEHIGQWNLALLF
jgi:hypothetical protein